VAGFDNPIHLIFVLALMLVVFGAKRLPEMGRSLGSGLRGFKDALSTDAAQQPALERVSAAASEDAARASVDTRAEASSGTS
jgi:sec-independent protein translocase protein TatA